MRGGYGINELDYPKVREQLREYRAAGFLPIIAVHAGIEHVDRPAIENIKMARTLAADGDYIYYGHHPHVIQGAEMVDGSLVAHSLGNFIFDDLERLSLSDGNRKSVVLEVEIEGSRVKSYAMTPIQIGKGAINVFKGEKSEYQNRRDDFDKALANIEEYTQGRLRERAEWIGERKAARSLSWYLRRLTPRYALLWLTNRRNAKKYNCLVKEQV